MTKETSGVSQSVTAFPRVDGALHCGPFHLRELAKRFGTPLFLYSMDFIRNRFRDVETVFAPATPLLAYSVKANGNLAVLNRLAGLGSGADIVSGGELFRALKAGITPGKILFAGVGKTDEELIAGLDARIYSFNVEAIDELHRLDEFATERGARAPFGVRINPDIKAPTPHEYTRTGHAETKFGLPVPVAVGLYRWAATRPHLRPRGIDVHIGSQISEPAPYKKALRKVLEVVHLLKKDGIPLEYVDLGGGYGIPTHDEGMDVKALAEALLPILDGSGLRLVLEPGRFLVGEAGVLLTQVRTVKRSGEKVFVITDAGMTELLRPSHYGGYHPVEPVVSFENREETVVDVVGPICETGDFLARDRPIPLPKAGEYLAVGNAGAYGFAMASNYNARPRAAEVMVEGDE
ncbi:MAG: diaminopimelate decarboxylase, partial [Gemmatimonadetes bacterium]|nr:diaminopimelate decarboxylase [Gemmatimonadota bacterium]